MPTHLLIIQCSLGKWKIREWVVERAISLGNDTSLTFSQSSVITGLSLCFSPSDHTSYWLLHALKKVRSTFHLSQDFSLLPWDTLTQNLMLNNLVKPAPSLICNVYRRSSYPSVPLFRKCCIIFMGTQQKKHTDVATLYSS